MLNFGDSCNFTELLTGIESLVLERAEDGTAMIVEQLHVLLPNIDLKSYVTRAQSVEVARLGLQLQRHVRK